MADGLNLNFSMRQRRNGEGTIYRRKDGRYEGAAYVELPDGIRKRVSVYGKTWQEAHDKLVVLQAQGLQRQRERSCQIKEIRPPP